MPRPASPVFVLPVAVGIAAFLLQAAVVGYLGGRAQARLTSEWRQAQTQIAQSLAAQIARAQADKNDLAALASLGSARSLHPQLQVAMVFDPTGKILLHTDPGQLGRMTEAPVGVRLTSPEASSATEGGRRLLRVLVPLPDRGEGYLRAVFDQTGSLQGGAVPVVHGLLLAACIAAVLAWGVWLGLRRYVWLDPAVRAEAPVAEATAAAKASARRVAELLLDEMPHAALALDRDNQVIAANTLALDLLNCRREELIGWHVLKAPLPAGLLEFYQQGMPTPGRPRNGQLRLSERAAALTASLTFAPASEQWELALLTLR